MATQTLDETQQLALFPEMQDELEIDKNDLAAIEAVKSGFLGFRCRKRMAPQSKSWPDSLKQAALAAVGGGDADSAAMSDRLFSKEIACVKNMNEALAYVDRIRTDRYYTLPHPEPGVRLVCKGKEQALREKIEEAAERIRDCAATMNADRSQIKAHMREKLGARYEQYVSRGVYDLDFTGLYVVEFRFVNIEVPSYLRHNEALYAEALKQAMKDARDVVEMTKSEMVKHLLETVDHLAERLESRRLLDGKHEVIDVRKHGATHIVTVRERGADNKLGDETTVELTEREYSQRVVEDTKRKTFTNQTAVKIFEALDYFEHQLNTTGIGRGEVESVFNKLKKVVRNYDKNSLPASLRESSGLRDMMKEQLGKVGKALLDLSVVQGERDILRRRTKSATLNPEKV